METKIIVQSTPNPNALKFVLNRPVKSEGNITYKSSAECQDNPLAKAIFDFNKNISEVYFYDNYITVSQNGNENWCTLEEHIRKILADKITSHNPDFKLPEKNPSSASSEIDSPEINQINSILDQTIRPALQMDGGDLILVSYENNVLLVSYQGACGSCPSATTGTLMAIESILRNQFNPEIDVRISDLY